MQLIFRILLRTFQAQIAKKIRTFGSGSASAPKNDVLTKEKSVISNNTPGFGALLDIGGVTLLS